MFLPLLTRLARWLPPPLRRHASPARLALGAQFLAFGCVGAAGFVLDTATVYALRHPLGLYGAGLVAYLVAATGNWALNRIWTFRGHRHHAPMHRQWARFVYANTFGFLLNRGTYMLLIAFVPFCAAEPVYAVAAGSLVGMVLNFRLTRRLVFREYPHS